ncbi:MAG: hypothetical protein IH987_14880 [Planctomycetes bacterium]|nr:hypothetical protein [Planctomycetota bacterium]
MAYEFKQKATPTAEDEAVAANSVQNGEKLHTKQAISEEILHTSEIGDSDISEHFQRSVADYLEV